MRLTPLLQTCLVVGVAARMLISLSPLQEKLIDRVEIVTPVNSMKSRLQSVACRVTLAVREELFLADQAQAHVPPVAVFLLSSLALMPRFAVAISLSLCDCINSLLLANIGLKSSKFDAFLPAMMCHHLTIVPHSVDILFALSQY